MINACDDTNFCTHWQPNTRFPINLNNIRMKTRTLNHHLTIITLDTQLITCIASSVATFAKKHTHDKTFD